MNIFVEFALVV